MAVGTQLLIRRNAVLKEKKKNIRPRQLNKRRGPFKKKEEP